MAKKLSLPARFFAAQVAADATASNNLRGEVYSILRMLASVILVPHVPAENYVGYQQLTIWMTCVGDCQGIAPPNICFSGGSWGSMEDEFSSSLTPVGACTSTTCLDTSVHPSSSRFPCSLFSPFLAALSACVFRLYRLPVPMARGRI